MSLLLETPPPSSLLPVANDRPCEVSRPQQDMLFAPVELSHATRADQPFWVEATSDVAVLERHRAAWQDLADHTIEPNPFYEPWMFLPAWEAFGHQTPGVRFVLVWRRDPSPQKPSTLVGFLPLIPARGFGGLPVRLSKTWQHEFCYLCSPLVRTGQEREVLNAILDWMAKERQGLLKLCHLPGEGPLAQAIIDVGAQRGASTFVAERYNRAMLHRAEDFKTYINASMSGSSRKDARRRLRNLSALGMLETRVLSSDPPSSRASAAPVDVWIREFMQVEASGWKGRQKSALNSHPATAKYFETICRAGFERSQMTMLGLYLDGRPVAMCCNFGSGEGSYAFKTGFDEKFGKYSPGVLAEIENIRLVHELPRVRWMDSCAVAKHSVLNRLWSGQRTIQKVLISPGRRLDNVAVEFIAAMSAVRRACFGKKM
ncbi:MAG: GNAT family N-acetyltransferase [Planctomycetota bacterium]